MARRIGDSFQERGKVGWMMGVTRVQFNIHPRRIALVVRRSMGSEQFISWSLV